MLKKIIALSILSVLGMLGCKTERDNIKWVDARGYPCSVGDPFEGCDYHKSGKKITASEDPYFSNLTYVYDRWIYVDNWGVTHDEYRLAAKSPNGIIYDEFGAALNRKTSRGYDDIGDVAIEKSVALKDLSEHLKVKFELSDAKSAEFAEAINAFNQQGRSGRGLQNMRDLSLRVFNVKFEDAMDALNGMQSGDLSQTKAQFKKAADHWGKNPEQMFRSLQKIFGEDVIDEDLKIKLEL